jgi:hypothetical protein
MTGFAQQLTFSQTGPYFGIGIEQYGRVIPIENHAVTLEKESFTIVLTFPGQEGILVNASITPESFDRAQARQPLDEIPGFSDLGMAEEAFNPRALIMLSSKAPHFWYYANDSEHRFNEVERQQNTVVCRRIVANVMLRDGNKQIVSLRNIPENTLYLVFMKTEWTNDFKQQLEKQRDYLKIMFQ